MKWYIFVCSLFLLSCVGGPSEQELLEDFERANRALKQGNYIIAIRTYDKILAESPEFIAAVNNRGIAYLELGQFQEALDNFDRALFLDDNDYDAAFNRTRALWLQGLWRPALKELISMTQTYDSAEVHFRIGQIYFEQNLLDSALWSYNRSLKIDPDNTEALINRGNIHYYLGNYSPSRTDIQKALDLDSQNPLAMNTMALLSCEEKSWLQALKWVKKALSISPEDPYIINNLGYVYLGLDSLPQAEHFINQSLLLDPENPWAYRNKAIWYLRSGRPQRTIDLLQQARTMDQGIPALNLFYYLGQAYQSLGDLQRACELWNEGRQLGEQRSAEKLGELCEQT